MTEDKMKIEDFLNHLQNLNQNKTSGDADYDDVFGKDKPFAIVCNKCGSMDIEIIGECGVEYGGWTGYQSGTTAIKCNGCGTAETIVH